MAKQRKRTLKRKAGGSGLPILSRGKSLTNKALNLGNSLTKKASNLGKTVGEEILKDSLKKQMDIAAKSIGKPALNTAINYIPKQIKEPSKKAVHFRSPTKQHVPMNTPFSPPPTTKLRNTRTFKAQRNIPQEGVMANLVEKTEVKRALDFTPSLI